MQKSSHLNSSINLSGTEIAIVQSNWHSEHTDKIVCACRELLEKNGCKIELHRVPGCYEIPFATKQLAKTKRFSAIVTVGAVVQGETDHYRMILDTCCRELGRIGYEFDLPIIMEILGVQKIEHLITRCSGEFNKGIEAAQAALEIISWARSNA